ncbi:MAG: hypothetical protein ACLGSD_11280 [Acidobacteriota bacterium]
MNIRVNPVIARRVGVALLIVGILGMLARNYLAAFKALSHGNVVDFSFGLFLGLGIALSLVRDWHGREGECLSIRQE